MSNHPQSNTLFISSSNDCTIRIWCLDKFTELYCFELPAGLTNIKLMNNKTFAAVYADAIKIGHIHHLALSFCNSRSNIRYITKCFTDEEALKVNAPFAIATLFGDNSTVIQDPDGRTLSIIYPPPTAKAVANIAYCMSLSRMFILLETGALCIYKIDRDTAILEKLQYTNQLRDSEGKGVNQTITCMTFASTTPPRFDCEIFSELKEDKNASAIDPYNFDYNDKYLVFGLSKGTIVFIHVDNLE